MRCRTIFLTRKPLTQNADIHLPFSAGHSATPAPREVFRAAVIGAAYAVVLMHNHPSGDPSPSDADIRSTHRLVEAGKTLQIEVCDHIIVGTPAHLSLREAGIIL